ncbi:hypothetical protein [Streptomyces sp. KMM 9044]|uniref:hypothetical protein n=1 Tax=Streptomyces sp. KMM 9044 TaxID=2744474 RepID=UPI002150CCFA|nr:hypothetical protein [Streptomyces sp. KMM 9044]WAX80474.1 hypothetical protein HUV60_025250 [Streptomyces sp. KMM 9044]
MAPTALVGVSAVAYGEGPATRLQPVDFLDPFHDVHDFDGFDDFDDSYDREAESAAPDRSRAVSP